MYINICIYKYIYACIYLYPFIIMSLLIYWYQKVRLPINLLIDVCGVAVYVNSVNCMCIWRPVVKVGCFPEFLSISFWDRASHWAQTHWFSYIWWPVNARGPHVSAPPALGFWPTTPCLISGSWDLNSSPQVCTVFDQLHHFPKWIFSTKKYF